MITKSREKTANKSVLQVEDLWFAHPASKSRQSWLFRGVSVDIQDGELFGIIGLGGCGKSSLLRLMAGLLRPAQGLVRLAPGSRLSMTFQKGGLFDSVTCAENLRIPLREQNFSRSDIEARVETSLNDVGLGGQGERMVHEISGGMQKRLGIARALIGSPGVILYDEPTAGLDPITSKEILELILRCKKQQQMTVVLVSSDAVQLAPLADRMGFLAGGRFAEIGSLQSLMKSEQPEVRRYMRAAA